MQRPHIPKLAFQTSSQANQRSTANSHPSTTNSSLQLNGTPAIILSPTHTSQHPLSPAARKQASQPQLFQSRNAPPPPISQQSHYDQSRYVENNTSNQSDEFAQDDEDEDDEEDYQSQPITQALSRKPQQQPRPRSNQPLSRPTPAYQQAEAMLDESEDAYDEDESESKSSNLIRRPLHDDDFETEDGVMSEHEFNNDNDHPPPSSNTARSTTSTTSSRRHSSRQVPDAATQLSAAAGTASSTAQPSRSRFDRGSLRTWVLTASQLRQRQELMEKEQLTWIQQKKTWFQPNSDELNLLSELERMNLESHQHIKKERAELGQEMKRIKVLVTRFKTHVSSPQDADAYVTQLRTLMESIEEALASFKTKAKEKYVELNKAEKELTMELDASLIGFERWSETDDVNNAATAGSALAKGKKPSKTSTTSSLTPSESDSTTTGESSATAEIRLALSQLDDQIESEGGASGGWDSRDHAHFLKLRTQLGPAATNASNPKPEFLARIVAEISNQTPATAMEHIEWYDRYRKNLETKKELIAKWKESKQVKDVEGVQEELARQLELEKEERKQLNEILALGRAEKAAAVAEWKARKQAREDARQAKLQAAKEEKERLARERQEDERRRLRSVVEAYQEEKAVQSLVTQLQSQPTQRELSERDRAEREARRRLKEKQEEELQRIRERREQKQAETARIQERKERAAQAAAASLPQTQRDPARLTQPTTAMLERARQREEEEERVREYQRTHGGRTPQTMMGRLSLGHTATPSWRKGL